MAKRSYSNRDYGDLKSVGKVKDAHSLKGELYVLIFSKDTSWIDDIEEFALIKAEGEALQYFSVDKVKNHRDGLIVKTPQLTDRTQAEAWKNALFLLPKSLFISEAGETIFLSEIQDFSVYDQGLLVGQIHSFSSNGAQDLLLVKSDEHGEVEIPFVADFILEIDFENKKVMMALPDGLLLVNKK